jgi:hypothetical protein
MPGWQMNAWTTVNAQDHRLHRCCHCVDAIVRRVSSKRRQDIWHILTFKYDDVDIEEQTKIMENIEKFRCDKDAILVISYIIIFGFH